MSSYIYIVLGVLDIKEGNGDTKNKWVRNEEEINKQ